jgi:hypothetical protein
MHRMSFQSAILVVLAFISLSFNANAIPIALTTAKSLTVRESVGGKVVDALPVGSVVGISNISGGWAYVIYFKGGNTSKPYYGWVSTKFLQITGGGASGGTCETEYQSGAEVCLEVSDADLECNKSHMGEFYRDCEVEVDYELSTDYRGESSINVDVECEAEISYKARESYNSSDSDDESESHNLYANGSDYGSIDIDFSFSSYKEVYSVELRSVECEISSMNLW